MVTPADRAACPEPERLAEFIEGRLTGAARAEVTAHLADCETCRQVFAHVARDGALTVLPFYRRPKVQAAAGVLALAASLIVVTRVQPELNPFRRPTAYEDLVAAARANRTVEGRLTGGFSYAPLRATTRGERPTDYQTLAAIAQLQQQAQADGSVESLRQLGVAYLLAGDVAQAVSTLEAAVARDDVSAVAWSDLSAAYIARAAAADRPDDLPRALAAAERAHSADTQLPEALFNRAVALSALQLRARAVEAWDAYLRRDGTGPWADEARQRKAVLSQESPEAKWQQELQRFTESRSVTAATDLRSASARAARDYLADTLLPSWAAAQLSGEVSSGQWLRLARTLQSVVQDPAVGELSSLERDDAATRQIAEAWRAYGDGRTKYEADEIGASQPAFLEAARLFREANHPQVYWAEFYLALVDYYNGRLDDATRRLDGIKAASTQATLVARAHWLQGIVRLIQSNLSASLTEYRRAIELFDASAEGDHFAFMHTLVAENLLTSGDYDGVWRNLLVAIRLLNDTPNYRRRHSTYVIASLACARAGLPECALHFQEALLANAAAWGQAAAVATGHLQRARGRLGIDDVDGAFADLAAAKDWLARISDPVFARQFESQYYLVHADASMRTSPANAVTELDSALRQFEATGSKFFLAQLYLARGKANRVLGNRAAAAGDFLNGIDHVQQWRRALLTQYARLSLADAAWENFDQAIDLAADDDRLYDALAYAEQARTAVDDVTADDVRRMIGTLPSRVIAAYFVVLEKSSLVFSIRTSSIAVDRLPIGRRQLADLAQLHQAELIAGAAGAASQSLARVSLTAVKRRIRPGDAVAIVPDGPLHGVSFAALLNADAAEDAAVTATYPRLKAVSADFAGESRQVRHALVVGAAAPIGMSKLPAVQREVNEVAARFPGATVLDAALADKASMLGSLADFELVHFAGHAVANEQYPSLSHLVLKGGDGSASSVLYAYELGGLRLSRTPLVVLSGCRTAGGKIFRGEGVVSLARAFADAGAHSVVATLWDIEDDAAAAFFPAFYEELKQQSSPAAAVAATQRAMRQHPDPRFRAARVWAGVVAFGGLALAAHNEDPR